MLYSQEFIDGRHIQTPLVILHGLFGSSQNWRQIAKALQAKGWPVYLLDCRNHGHSPHDERMNYTLMADDVIAWLAAKQLSVCHLLGHSMGGKIAMQCALTQGERLQSLTVADIAPVAYPPRHQDVFAAIHKITEAQPQSRKAADDLIKTILPDMGTRLFLLTNLERANAEGVKWKSNMAAIDANYADISAAPAACLADNPVNQFAKPTLVIKGEQSPYINNENIQTFSNHFTHLEIQTLAAGHWLHAEKPAEFVALVTNFLNSSLQDKQHG